MIEFLNVGFEAYVNMSKIRIVAPTTAVKLRRDLKKRNLDRSSPQCFDATNGKEVKSIILLDDGSFVLSAINAETLAKRNTKSQIGGNKHDREL